MSKVLPEPILEEKVENSTVDVDVGQENSKRSRKGGDDRRGTYDEIKKENAHFTDYYKRQNLLPESEWEAFTESLGTHLPTTFRLTGHREEAASLKQQLETLLPGLGAIAHPLEWYTPKGFAWHLDAGRKALRSDPAHNEFHKWLVAVSENGDVSRQEAVSMVPPLLLDVQADHLVLDMCAAPGSKTTQIVEQMHADAQAKGVSATGLVVANDADQQRAYLLYHHVKRILSPCLMVTNNDGTMFPFLTAKSTKENQKVERVLFDRILADVPCSGDGTLRKNAMVWRTWSVNLALGLNPLQVRLLEKAARLLKVGGRMVYSTCSMNFVENEAVVAYVLNKFPHALEIVDVSEELPGLKRYPGHCSWKVISKDGEEYKTFEDVPAEKRRRIPESVFPQESYQNLHLERCMRIYPHLQNTGAFFVTVISKKAELSLPTETSAVDESTSEEPKVRPVPNANLKVPKPKFGVPKTEGEFRMLDGRTDVILDNIFSWYGIDKEALLGAGYGFLVRSEREPIKVITMISPTSSAILEPSVPNHRQKYDSPPELYNTGLKLVNVGVRAFEVYESSRTVPCDCQYRLLSESIVALRPFMTKRVSKVSKEEMISLLQSQDSVRIAECEAMGQGGSLLETISTQGHTVAIPVWISERGVKAFVPNTNRPAILLQLQ